MQLIQRVNVWVKSATPPQDKNVGWIDVSDPDNWTARIYNGLHVEDVDNPTPAQMGWDSVAGITQEVIDYIEHVAQESKDAVEDAVAQVQSLKDKVEQNADNIEHIEGLIPAQASSSNQLADKAFVNSTVQTGTANFRGSWSSLDDVPSIESSYPIDYAGSHTPTVNDYLVVQNIVLREWVAGLTYYAGDVYVDSANGYLVLCIKDHDSSTVLPSQDTTNWKVWIDLTTIAALTGTWRFKYTGNWDTNGKFGWQPEYQVNETPMTAAQLAALNSNITAAKVTKLDALPENAALQQSLGDLTPLVLTYGTSYGEDTYNALEAIAVGSTNRKAFIKEGGNNIYPASVQDYGAVYVVQAVRLNEPDLSGAYKFSCVIAPNGADGYDTEWSGVDVESKAVFTAVYGETTAQEIVDAYEAGKVVVCFYNRRTYIVTEVNYQYIFLSWIVGPNSWFLRVVRSTDTWAIWGAVSMQDSAYRVIANPSSSDLASTDKYPSMKIMADYVDEKLGDIETLLAAI